MHIRHAHVIDLHDLICIDSQLIDKFRLGRIINPQLDVGNVGVGINPVLARHRHKHVTVSIACVVTQIGIIDVASQLQRSSRA